MLDEDEYQQASVLYGEGFKKEVVRWLSDRQERFRRLLDYYFELTGFQETEPNAIMHHRIEQYGPPCESCGKPYRTKRAAFCAACGHKRN